jgi:hypothetical protein
MPPTDALRLDAVYTMRIDPRKPMKLLRGWKRLEGRPRVADFERSLRAEVRDPLWFLARQWQFGEFQGEDAASPIDVAIGMRSAPLATLRIGDDESAYDPAVPLETRVEREGVPFDLTLHMQASRCLTRLLTARFIGHLLQAFVAEWPLAAGSVSGQAHADADRLFAAGAEFLFDTGKLLTRVRAGTFAAAAAAMTASITERGLLVSAADELRDWFDRTYGQTRTEPPAWRPERLSYQFRCETAAGPDRATLTADEYQGGMLDWYAFDMAAPTPAAGAPADAATLSFLPTGIDFAGMPSARFWEMENSRTEFGRIDANTNDLAKLLLAEFVLLFSNDWCVTPLELNIGTFSRIDGVLVTDVFGDQTWVRAANRGAGASWHNWSMYLLTGDDDQSPGLFLAPALTSTVEAPPIEQVQFIRDEMANMVWAIEQRLASRLGDGLLQGRGTGRSAAVAAETRYVLGTSVPDNWRPFIPVHLPGSQRSIRLQRAQLPGPVREPQAEVLRVAGHYFLEEEEVPRAGRIVQRIFQRSRWHDGSTFLWLGRRSQTGRGEGSSGLAFDHILERGEAEIG